MLSQLRVLKHGLQDAVPVSHVEEMLDRYDMICMYIRSWMTALCKLWICLLTAIIPIEYD